MTQYVYRFGGGVSDGGKGDKNLLGGKGANLAEMASIGLPVPPGFTISTEFCEVYYDEGRAFPQALRDEVATGIAHIEGVTAKKFGDAGDPLLVSVRSGARASMPGMMDTVLNLGLNDETVKGLAATSGDDRFAWDSYRRFIQMYADVVLELDHGSFEEALEIAKEDKGYYLDTELSAEDLQALVAEYKALVEAQWNKPFPQDVHDQLWGAVGAVFGSWQSERAKVYRRLNDIPAAWGTAVNVQAMVFGNMGDTSATGVAFTRDPAKGDRAYYGEFLINAQGEDVVAGIRTPQYLTKAARETANAKPASMEEAMPVVFGELAKVFDLLETHYRDMQDIEFTVQQGKLWMLQTRSGKRTAKAALKIAVDMAEEGLITREEAVARVDPQALDQLLHPTLDPNAVRDVLTKGLPASPGAASGAAVFDSDTAEKRAAAGDSVILIRVETSPEDIHGMHAAKGILTARGGMTSHAAVVARGMGRPCVSGAGTIAIDAKAGVMRVAGREIREGDTITIDGTTGEVMAGAVPTVQPELSGDFGTLMEWADGVRRLKVRANAETPLDARVAREFGAEGIGLCRTEHMFFDAARITAVRQMILAEDEKGRRAALDKLLPEQRADFVQLFEVMAGLPVTIRLLDPPLHEFLPHEESEFAEVATAAGVDVDILKRRAAELHEFNPMLGHRGCRLGVTYPEIYEMQARAIFEAAIEVAIKSGAAPIPEVMIPLVATRRELELMKAVVEKAAQAVFADKGRTIEYLIGTMIELPRACLMAGEIAEVGAFFSFGTNDLTQTTLGVSRDDAARFLTTYVERGIYAKDPFVSLDIEGVGQLIELAAERGRATRPEIKLGICGEHGGDPASIAFCERIGLDYVSASPYRVPIARLAAAQAALGKAG
ncbi:pyruvate, phosphate dikinase [Sphingomonas sp. So64.6b]|uniref:pyruvate, phosphate dikinase n=1 Tax=Sphingomonas sp. So64.6b TaxID=2997354 RepID=UPI0015FF3B98|nr:pyruvate, phosphate dikinase [Sphingomonas sp. So64.6b]QNA84772.1 pyruvate, phosphate dikinase [Sphingomonas sp. So64.6b]